MTSHKRVLTKVTTMILLLARRVAALCVLSVLLLQPAAASTLTITGGLTQLTLGRNLPALGFTASPTGTASFVGEAFHFPISGGTLDEMSGDALIEHAGAGVTLTRDAISVSVGDFLIDTVAGAIFGSVNGGGSLVDLFTLVATDGPRLRVRVSAPLADALSAIYGTPNLAGETIGFATTAPQTAPAPVPLPAGMPLLLAGLAAVGALRFARGRATA